MAKMTSSNIIDFKLNLAGLENEVKCWSPCLANLESQINQGKGEYFKHYYVKGKKACDNIQKVIDALKNIQRDLNNLCETSRTFANNLEKYEK